MYSESSLSFYPTGNEWFTLIFFFSLSSWTGSFAATQNQESEDKYRGGGCGRRIDIEKTREKEEKTESAINNVILRVCAF